jgi:murein endopeptidase
LMNRHYVHEDLYAVLLTEAEQMQKEFPETITYYLDACFPLGAKFPLLPHWSHNDGRKVDLAFYYIDATTKENKNGSPSWLGYGVCESPIKGEENMPEFCAEKGYFQYSFLEKIVPQHKKGKYAFDRIRTKSLIDKLIASSKIKKIFIEPHLKKRMKLTSSKIRFHGCHAVRHDDHIHVQL